MDDPGFWWNWGVQALVALGTIGAVLVALFGDFLHPPKLRLSLDNPNGVFALVQHTVTDTGGGTFQSAAQDARYYHMRVTNHRRWFSAHHVQVLLLQVEALGQDNNVEVKWTGEIPLGWQNQALYPTARTIGHAASVDLCSVVRGQWLQLHPLMRPINLTVFWPAPCALTLTLQARGDEGDSPPVRVRVAWDGQWADGSQGLQGHLSIEALAA